VLTDLLGLSYANILADQLGGTSACISDSTIHSYALHDDWIGCIYTQLPFLNRTDDDFIKGRDPLHLFPLYVFLLDVLGLLASYMVDGSAASTIEDVVAHGVLFHRRVRSMHPIFHKTVSFVHKMNQ
jgi:hypothetical protein